MNNNVHIRATILWKIMNLLIYSAIGQIVSLLFFYKDGYGIRELTKFNMSLKKESKTNHIAYNDE